MFLINQYINILILKVEYQSLENFQDIPVAVCGLYFKSLSKKNFADGTNITTGYARMSITTAQLRTIRST